MRPTADVADRLFAQTGPPDLPIAVRPGAHLLQRASQAVERRHARAKAERVGLVCQRHRHLSVIRGAVDALGQRKLLQAAEHVRLELQSQRRRASEGVP